MARRGTALLSAAVLFLALLLCGADDFQEQEEGEATHYRYLLEHSTDDGVVYTKRSYVEFPTLTANRGTVTSFVDAEAFEEIKVSGCDPSGVSRTQPHPGCPGCSRALARAPVPSFPHRRPLQLPTSTTASACAAKGPQSRTASTGLLGPAPSNPRRTQTHFGLPLTPRGTHSQWKSKPLRQSVPARSQRRVLHPQPAPPSTPLLLSVSLCRS